MHKAIYFGRFFLLALLMAGCVWTPRAAQAAFGLTSDANFYTVDTGAGLVFQIRRTDNGSNTQSPGDIASLVYNGVEYQDQTRGSQLNSGFDWLYNGISAVTVSAAVVNTNYIEVTVQAGNLTHYYLARNGFPHIYMGTYFTAEPDTLGLCRYIVRIPSALLPNGPTPSDIRNTVRTVESSDIFALSDGTTRSKHYSNARLTDWSYIGATGSNVGIFMVRDNNEGNSGGPFYRCLLNQCGDDQEITYIVNYGEGQTEAFRPGILNTYTLAFTNGAAPSLPVDTSWLGAMGLTGYVSPAGRGSVTGAGIAGRDPNYAYTVGFSNSTAQYWTSVRTGDGSFNCANMLPGIYTMTVYKNELAVSTSSVSVSAGSVNSLNTLTITGDPSSAIPLWRIGDWDGTPQEFLNGDKITFMHPSDVRISTWNPGVYTVGVSSPATGFPCYQWKNVNGTQTVQFTLPPALVAAYTIRVGITCAYSNARPQITVNSWTSPSPDPSTQPSTRSLTIGTYRGNNTTYAFSVPASAFVAGTNTMTLFPISGSTGTTFLSPGYSVDCVDMTTPAATIANDTYALVPRHAPASALDVQNAGTGNGNPIDIHTYTGADSQRFLLDLQSDGSYRIRTALAGNMCLDLPYGNTANGINLQLYDDNGLSPQHWFIIPNGDGWYRIAPKLDVYKAVDTTNAGTADGTLVRNWDYIDNIAQQWKLVPSRDLYTKSVPNDTYVLSSQNAPGSVLDVPGSNTSNGTQLDIHTYTGVASQQFLFDLQTDGTYRIRTALAGNNCVDLNADSPTNGTVVQMWGDDGLDNQRWYLIPISGGYYKIAPKVNIDKALEIYGFSTADGSVIDDWDYLGGVNQLWKLTPTSAITVTAVSGTPGQSVTLGAVLKKTSDGTALAGKTLSFSVDGTVAGTTATSSSGIATLVYVVPVGMLAGSHTISASFAGDSASALSAGMGTLTVTKAVTVMTLTNATGVQSQTVTLTARLLRKSGAAPLLGKTLTFQIDGATVGTSATNSSGFANLSYLIPSGAAVGAHTLAAAFAGDGGYNPSSITGTLTVNPAATALSVANDTGAVGQTVTLSAALKSGGIAVSGATVTFAIDGTAAGSGVTTSSGTATYSYTVAGALPVGSHTISASFAGDSSHAASSGTGTLTVAKAVTVMTLTNAAGTRGQSVTLTARLLRKSGAAPLLGKTLTFSIDGTGVGTAATNSSGFASLSYVVPAGTTAGTHPLAAAFAGDSGYNPSSISGTFTAN